MNCRVREPMTTQILTNLTCPSCGHSASGVKPGTRCPKDDGFVLVDARVLTKHGRDSMLGRVLADKYALVDLIGQGGMGSVYVGVHEAVGREVAVKVIRRLDGAAAEQMRGRFAREAKVIGRLSHDNLVTLYDFGEDTDGTLYLVMEYLRGQSLAAKIRAHGSLPPTDAVLVANQILAAIAEAHELGLVHRDLKPENVMLVRMKDGTDRVKVLDFGIAKVLSGGDHTVETRQGLVLGTPRYMAPEQAIGVNIGPKSDLYACGVLLYEMLTGKAPFTGETPFAILTAHRIEPVPPLPDGLGVPPALESALRTALAKEPDQRFADATTMAAALRASVGLDAGTNAPALRIAEPELGETMALGATTTGQLSGQVGRSTMPPAPSNASRTGVVAGVGIAAAAVVAVGYYLAKAPAPAASGVTATAVAQPAVVSAAPTEGPERPTLPVPSAVQSAIPVPTPAPAVPSSSPPSTPSVAPVVTSPVASAAPTAPPTARPAPPRSASPPPSAPRPPAPKSGVKIDEF